MVAPSILAADFAHLADDTRSALDAGGSLVHLDVMDGHFVPNLSMGPALCASLRRALPEVCFDVHLMVTDPGQYVEAFAKAGADHITFHAEVLEQIEAIALANRVRDLGCTVGIAINPETGLDRVTPLLDSFEMLLIMSVHPGFGGQAFIESVLEKAEQVRQCGPDGLILEIDGGIGPRTGPTSIRAGCDILVAGSAIFSKAEAERAPVIRSMYG